MLELAVRADNAGAEAIGDLTLGVTIGSAVRSRTAYETSLTEGPGLPIFAVTNTERDAVDPGGTRRFRTSVDLSTIGGISRTDSLVYPMRIDLRSAGTQVAVLDTAVIFVVRTPEVPLLVSTTIELTAPPAFDPERTPGRHRVRGVDRPGGLPVGAGGGARPAGERSAGQPHRSGHPAIAPRPAGADGRRV